MEVVFKCRTNHREIIHEDFNGFFDHVRKYCHHASLKGSWGVTQPKWHSLERECAIRACEGGFLLIFRSNGDMIVFRISIQKAKVLIPRESI